MQLRTPGIRRPEYPPVRPSSPPGRTLSRCLVCGFSEVRTDEVTFRSTVFLSECPRCEHRWTSEQPPAPVRRVCSAREVRSAA